MLKIGTILLFFLGLFSNLIAQNKNDNTWILGYPPNDSSDHFGGTKVDFSSSPPQISFFHLKYNVSNIALICNDTGNLQFYTNGCTIINSFGEAIKNTDSLNFSPGNFYHEYCISEGSYDVRQGMIALPWPGRTGEYVLFHLAWSSYTFPNNTIALDRFFYTRIDMNANSKHGQVMEKNNLLVQDSMLEDNVTAVRHGNGRDWWVLVPKGESDVMCMFLLTPYGIKGPMEIHTGIVSKGYWYNGGQITFSPDGTKFIQVNPIDGVNIFNFDRCAGFFSCPIHLPYPGNLDDTDNICSGASVASGSRYLYVSTCLDLYQYDLWAKDIEHSKIHVGAWDGTWDELGIASRFYQQILAPDGKIYMSASNPIYRINVIEHPDSASTGCDFRQHELTFPSRFGFSVPNFPHYRLYDLPGSPCDSLGINAPDGYNVLWSPGDAIRITPNPVTTGPVSVTLPACGGGLLKLYAATGALLREYPVGNKNTYFLNCTDLPSAVYFVTFWPDNGHKPMSAKLLIAR